MLFAELMLINMTTLYVLLGLQRYQVCLEDEYYKYADFHIATGINAVQMHDGIQADLKSLHI